MLEIYQQQNEKKHIRNLALDLFVNDSFNPEEYYEIYKKTFTEEEWKDEKYRLARQLEEYDEGPPKFGFSDFTPLTIMYVEEQMWDRLIMWIKQSPNIYVLNEYLPYLREKYPNDLLYLFREAILRQAKRASQRNEYRKLTAFLEKMATIPGGKDKAKELADELLQEHSNRPAMQDEFRKAGYH